MARSDIARSFRGFGLLCGIAVIGALYLASDVLLPFCLAILVSFLLAPFVSRIETWKCPRVPAVLIVVAVAFAGLGALSYVIAHQVYDLADRLPEYKVNIIDKVQALRGSSGGVLGKVADTLAEVRSEAAGEQDATPQQAAEPRAAPVPVEVVEPLDLDVVGALLGPVVGPLGTAAIVFVFVVFMLIEREDLRNRMIHLVGTRQLNVTTQAIDDAAGRVSRYLRMQLIINAVFGLVIGAGLYAIGLPNALLWGVIAGALRFLPFIGPWIAALLVLAVSLAVFDGWTKTALVCGLFVANELISNNVLEPWLYGVSTGISSIGILVSAVFWTWLWGPVGLVMATPLTVCLLAIGRHVPQLAFFNKLLSTQEAPPPQDRFYQRLLALDPDEAHEVAEEFLADHSLEALYDEVLLPALSLAEQDRHDGELEEAKERLIIDTLRELVEDLGARATASDSHAESTEPVAVAPTSEARVSVVCLPARDEADEIAGMMLAQLLETRGVKALVLSHQVLVGEMLAQVEAEDLAAVCVSALPPFAVSRAQYLCKRLRPKFPRLSIVVGLWQMSGRTRKAEARLAAANVQEFVTTLAEAAEQISHLSACHRFNVETGVRTALQPAV